MGSHLIVMHSMVRACPGYSRHDAPSILMDGTSVDRESEHGRTVTAQLTRRQGTLEEAIQAGAHALGAAGLGKGIRRQALAAAENYFYTRLALEPGLALDFARPLPPTSLELMPEPMYKAIEEIVEYAVDGDYAGLRDASNGRLGVDDLYRRLEEDCPAALALPPREHYTVEAIAASEEPGEPEWAYFVDLWTEEGLAQLHIEGELVESGGRYTITLDDIGP